MSASPYTTRLSGEEIRLISFANEDEDDKSSRDHNNNDENNPVSCNLTQFSLHDTIQESFDALSYCWGDPNLRKPILVNGKPWTITEQLDQALRRLHELCPDRQIWVDALCINQEDNAEKNIQVPLMATIYRNAEHVYIWLGPSNEILDEFVVFMRNEEMKKDDPKNLDRYVVFSLAFFYLPWWSRTWTFQEFLLANRPIFLLGTHVIPFTEMRIWVLWFIWVLWLTTGQGLQTTGPNPNGTTTWEEAMLARPSDLCYDVEAVKLFGDNYAAMLHRWPKGILFAVMVFEFFQNQHRNEPLLHLLLVTGGQELSDPRDKIYALHNLLSIEEQAKIHVDYNEKEWQVYHRTIRSMWVSWKTQYLTLMEAFQIGAEGSRSDPETPSWVVNFAARRIEPGPIFLNMMAKTPWHGAQSILELSPDGLALSILATRFCRIRVVQGIGVGVNIYSEECCKQLKAITETLVTARFQKCDSTSRLASIEELRTRELPLELFCRNPKSLDAMAELAGLLGISKAQPELVGLYVEFEIMRRSATDLAQLIKGDWDSALIGLDRTLKVILETIICPSRQPFYFVTKEGFYGFSKARPAENDCIVLPRGSKMFLILRPVFGAKGTAGKQHYRVVGPAYVAGLMDFEELAEMMDEEAKREEVFEVV